MKSASQENSGQFGIAHLFEYLNSGAPHILASAAKGPRCWGLSHSVMMA